MPHSYYNTERALLVLHKPLPKTAVLHHYMKTRLVWCDNQKYHLLLHQRQRALEASGHAQWLKCHFCKQYDEPFNVVVATTSRGGLKYHPSCANKYVKEGYRKARSEKDSKIE